MRTPAENLHLILEAIAATETVSVRSARPSVTGAKAKGTPPALPGGDLHLMFRADLARLSRWYEAMSVWQRQAPLPRRHDGEARWLLENLDVAASHPAAPDYYADLTELGGLARAIVEPARTRPKTIPCLAEDYEGGPCQGRVPLSGGLAQCRRCGAMWDCGELMRRHAPSGAWLPPDDAAEVLGVSVRTVTRWADEGRLKRSEAGWFDVLSLRAGAGR